MADELILRTAGRVFVVDADKRVLLMHERKDFGSDRSHWITPGGGVEAGESLSQAAVREVFEETGLTLSLPVDAHPIFVERVAFSLGGRTFDQHNHYFLVRVPNGLTVHHNGQTEFERDLVLGHRWWSLAELDTSNETREPVTMVDIIGRSLVEE
jgi:8-oxo-dGTP pyrophosphatase MutT (NUDIX family)